MRDILSKVEAERIREALRQTGRCFGRKGKGTDAEDLLSEFSSRKLHQCWQAMQLTVFWLKGKFKTGEETEEPRVGVNTT